MARRKIKKLSEDDTPMVRRGAAQSLSLISEHLEAELGETFLLPIIKALLEDQNDSVKINAVMSSVSAAKLVKNGSLLRDSIFPAFRNCCENRFSWRLRFAVAEQAAFLASYVDRETVDREILNFYELLLRDGEPEVRSEAVSKLPEVAKNCSVFELVENILPILKEQMANDQSQHVKGVMASAICELAATLP
jgi:serine/threonine-protein phosphatase 2A regulatory subunit A